MPITTRDDARGDERVGARRRRPWWLHGSSVTYDVAPRAAVARLAQREDLGVRLPGARVEALADDRAVATITQPTSGLGAVAPRPRSASATARDEIRVSDPGCDV